MNKSLIICDRLMFGALLGMVLYLPYSLAMIEVFQVMMILAWIARQGWRSQGFDFLSSSMGRSLIVIALLIALTIPFSHYPALSAKKLFSRFLQQAFLMYLVTQIINSRKRLWCVLAMLFFTLSFVIFDIVIQYTCGKSWVYHTPLIYGRVTGPMNHPNDLGGLLVTILPVVLVSITTCRRWVPVPWLGAAVISLLFLLLTIALGLTSSRGSWLAFTVSMIALAAYLKKYKAGILMIIMLAVFFWVFGVHCLSTREDMYNGRILQGSVIKPSFSNPFGLPPSYNVLGLFVNPEGRESYWGTAAGVIKHYPWFGCGYSAYVQTLRDLHVGHEEYPHNSLLHITAELGFLGLILYGWFFTALSLQIKNVLRVISRERDLFLLGCGLTSGILAWVIHSLTDTDWGSLQLSVLWWLFIGILLSLRFISTKEGENRAPSA